MNKRNFLNRVKTSPSKKDQQSQQIENNGIIGGDHLSGKNESSDEFSSSDIDE